MAAPISKKNTKEEGSEQKKMKREHYVSMQKEKNENEKQKLFLLTLLNNLNLYLPVVIHF
jgi:hypothetical protein